MPRILMLFISSPYGTDHVYHGLRLAQALRNEGAEVEIMLMADATGAALDGQSSANDDTNLGNRIKALLMAGATVKICGLCFETRGYPMSHLIPGIQVGTMPEVAQSVLASERVLQF